MISGVSTRSISLALQRSIQSLQREVLDRQKEMQTGTISDVGSSLGAKSSTPLSLLRDVSRLNSILETNKAATVRLRATQDSLTALREAAHSVLSSLTSGNQTTQGRQIAAESARTSLGGMVSTLNTTVAGQYIFAGLNSDAAPIKSGTGIPAGIEMDAAFLARFGFAKADPAAATITPSAFQTFLTSDVEPLFFGPGWASTVSTAADETIRSRITLTEVTATSVSANETGIRQSIFAAALAANFLATPLNSAVADGIIKTSVLLSATAQGGIAGVQANAGFVQEKLAAADVHITTQRDLFLGAAEDLTAANPYATATRLNSLLTQIETSYALTQKIQNMSILRYLS
jgi:flagellar hook-associated protein 3 FlgL